MGTDGDELRSPPSSARIPSAATSSSTPFTPSSFTDKKGVLLTDWWLVKVKSDHQGKNLAISGFTTRQQATRVFSSAPIIKRHDAYTLETADGITITIQGIINKARSQDNGYPLEVCSRFLIGFPYNWDDYADERCEKESYTADANANKDSLEKADSISSFQINEFPIPKFVDFLTSAGHNLSTNFIDNLQKFNYTKTGSQLHKLSSSSIESISRSSMDKEQRNICESDTLPEHFAEDHAADLEQGVGFPRNDLHVLEKDIGSSTVTNVICNSLSHPNMNSVSLQNIPLEIQLKTSFTSIQGAEMSKTMAMPTSLGSCNTEKLLTFAKGELSAKGSSTSHLEKIGTATLEGPDGSLHTSAGELVNEELQVPTEASKLQITDTTSSIFVPTSSSIDMIESEFLEESKGKTKQRTEVLVAEPSSPSPEQNSRRRRSSRLLFQIGQSPLTRERAKKLSMASPESLKLRRSKSGRLLVPTLDNACQQIVYDKDGLITGIKGVGANSPCKGRQPEPAKRRKFA